MAQLSRIRESAALRQRRTLSIDQKGDTLERFDQLPSLKQVPNREHACAWLEQPAGPSDLLTGRVHRRWNNIGAAVKAE